jgi:hypothetical protein
MAAVLIPTVINLITPLLPRVWSLLFLLLMAEFLLFPTQSVSKWLGPHYRLLATLMFAVTAAAVAGFGMWSLLVPGSPSSSQATTTTPPSAPSGGSLEGRASKPDPTPKPGSIPKTPEKPPRTEASSDRRLTMTIEWVEGWQKSQVISGDGVVFRVGLRNHDPALTIENVRLRIDSILRHQLSEVQEPFPLEISHDPLALAAGDTQLIEVLKSNDAGTEIHLNVKSSSQYRTIGSPEIPRSPHARKVYIALVATGKNVPAVHRWFSFDLGHESKAVWFAPVTDTRPLATLNKFDPPNE